MNAENLSKSRGGIQMLAAQTSGLYINHAFTTNKI
jgi:hypothetical protein